MAITQEKKIAIALEVLRDRLSDIDYSDVYEREDLEDEDEEVHQEIFDIVNSATAEFTINGEVYS